MERRSYPLAYAIFIFVLLVTFLARADECFRITKQNAIYLEGSIDQTSVDEILILSEKFRKMSVNQPKYLVLNSGGGSTFHGERLLAQLRTIKNLHTITLESSSMAAFLVQELPGKRYMLDVGSMLFHKIYLLAYPNMPLTEETLAIHFYRLKALNNNIARRISPRLKLTVRQYLSRVRTDWVLTAKQALKHNAIDSIVIQTKTDPNFIEFCENPKG